MASLGVDKKKNGFMSFSFFLGGGHGKFRGGFRMRWGGCRNVERKIAEVGIISLWRGSFFALVVVISHSPACWCERGRE